MVALASAEKTIIKIRANSRDTTVATKEKTIEISNSKSKSVENFPLLQEKEVMKVPLKKSNIVLSATTMGLSLALGLATPVFAQEASSASVSLDLVKFVIKGAMYLDILAIAGSLFFSPIIGIVTPFNQGLAKDWLQNLFRAVGITLFLQMLLIGLVYFGHLLFGSNPYYIDPWNLLAPALVESIKEVAQSIQR